MVTDVITLLELVRSLIQRKSELDKEYFEDFIKPVWLKFDRVHSKYIEAFSECKNYLESQNFQDEFDEYEIIKPVLKILNKSSLMNSESRVELNKLIQNLPTQSHGTPREKLLSDFIETLFSYFTTPELKSLRKVLEDNLYILKKSHKLNKENALQIIEVMIKHIKQHYEDVADKYYQLRKELLT